MIEDKNVHVAVVGSGAAGLSAAWLLAKRHKVTLVEKDDRLGGHSHTATVLPCANVNASATSQEPSALKIDTGFIVYNEPSYPNLTRWFDAMSVQTQDSDMSFAVSRDNGDFEYAGGPALGLLAQPLLPLRPRFWKMLTGLIRFYKQAPSQIPPDSTQTLGSFLKEHGYSDEFVQDHLLPFGAAIWSTSKDQMLGYPAAAFIRFCDNHGLLKISNRPQWRTVTGGSECYVNTVRQVLGEEAIKTDFHVTSIRRNIDGVVLSDNAGHQLKADYVVIAAHADQALNCLETPSAKEAALLGNFTYESNLAVLHTDESYLPKRRRAWCSWNYVEYAGSSPGQVSVSYWMNRLQSIAGKTQYIVTLNPPELPSAAVTHRTHLYDHPVFTAATWQAQQDLWSLQGQNRTWFCGSYFGAGFHEDAVQSGLAVAEQLGGVARPWRLKNPSTRIVVPSTRMEEVAGVEVAA